VVPALAFNESLWFSIVFYFLGLLIRRPPTVVKSSTVKILWDFSLQSVNHHLSNCPDIVLFNYDQKIYFVEISCPADVNVLSKEQEKLQKYQALAYDYHLMYRMPVVMHSCGNWMYRCRIL